MIRVLVMVAFLVCTSPVFAMPQFLQMFRNDPFRNPAVDGCNTCHMSPQGGDARNAFGQAFESGGERITPMLRAQFPDRFIFPVRTTSRLSLRPVGRRILSMWKEEWSMTSRQYYPLRRQPQRYLRDKR